jgi:uncharacterized protein (TIRG00374 family)
MKKWRLHNLLTLVGIAALAAIILFNRGQLENVWHLVKHLHWYIIVIIIVVQLASYWTNGLYYRSILRVFGYDLGVRRLFEGALATNFVNYMLPTAGMAGAGYLSQVLSPEVPRGQSVLTQFMRYALASLAVLIMLPVGILLLFLSHNSAHSVVKATIISAGAIALLGFVIVGVVQQESALRQGVTWFINKLQRLFPKINTEIIQHFVEEFYKGYHAMTRQRRRLLLPFMWSIAYIVIEIGTFYLVFLAFGQVINPGIAVMAYLFANIVSIFGGVIVSTGVFELGMAGTLLALGTPLALAIAVTTVYRVLNMLIGLPPGFYFYRKYLPK